LGRVLNNAESGEVIPQILRESPLFCLLLPASMGQYLPVARSLNQDRLSTVCR
jgi:hypothetical protein